MTGSEHPGTGRGMTRRSPPGSAAMTPFRRPESSTRGCVTRSPGWTGDRGVGSRYRVTQAWRGVRFQTDSDMEPQEPAGAAQENETAATSGNTEVDRGVQGLLGKPLEKPLREVNQTPLSTPVQSPPRGTALPCFCAVCREPMWAAASVERGVCERCHLAAARANRPENTNPMEGTSA